MLRFLRYEEFPGIPDRIFLGTVVALFFFAPMLILLNEFLELRSVTLLTGTFGLSALLAMVLIHFRWMALAKLVVHVHAAFIICTISMMFSQASAVLFFILPVFVSLVVVFDERERPWSIAVAVVLFLLSIGLLAFDPRVLPVELEEGRIAIVRSVSFFGALAFTLFQVGYTVHVNTRYRHELLELNREADVYNSILETSVMERNRLIQMISHDLRSPFINLILGMDDAVIVDLQEQERIGIMRRLRSDAKSTLGMLDGILLWVRSRQGSLKMDIHPNPVRPVLEHVLEVLAPDASRKGVELVLHSAQDGLVQADRFALGSVLRNLAANAVKFTPPGGRVSLEVAASGGLLRFTVADTGRGMSAEELANVRSRISFSSRGTEHEKGHGVGLLIVQEFLDHHGALLSVESIPGEGTRFTFELPSA